MRAGESSHKASASESQHPGESLQRGPENVSHSLSLCSCRYKSLSLCSCRYKRLSRDNRRSRLCAMQHVCRACLCRYSGLGHEHVYRACLYACANTRCLIGGWKHTDWQGGGWRDRDGRDAVPGMGGTPCGGTGTGGAGTGGTPRAEGLEVELVEVGEGPEPVLIEAVPGGG